MKAILWAYAALTGAATILCANQLFNSNVVGPALYWLLGTYINGFCCNRVVTRLIDEYLD